MCLATHRLRAGNSRGDLRRLGLRGHARVHRVVSPSPAIPLLQVGRVHPCGGSLSDAGNSESDLRGTCGGASPECGAISHAASVGAGGRIQNRAGLYLR